MEIFKGEKQRERQFESRGKNIEINVIFVRHGEKGVSTATAETALSEKGREKSIEYGERLEEKKAIKTFSSKTERAEGTAKLITEHSPTEKKMKKRIRQELAFHYDPNGNFAKEAMKIKRETLGENFDKLTEGEKKERIKRSDARQINYYLSFGDKRPDLETYSPMEAAAMMAKRLDVYMRMPEKLDSGSQIDLLNVSHDFLLSAFLKELIIREKEGQKVRGFQTVDEIGGPIEFNESYEILIKTDEEGKKSTKIKFRGQEYGMDTERLADLVETAKELESE